jgi:hypothetical protein
VSASLELIAKRLQQAGLDVLSEDAHALHRIPLLRQSVERRNEGGDADEKCSPASHSTAC